jgi:ribosomal protein S6--L-glutamate ligase
MKIAILSSSSNLMLKQTAERMGHSVTVLNPLKCYMVISPNVKGFDALFHGDMGDKPERIKRDDFDVVINRIGGHVDHAVNVLTFMKENLGVKTVVTPGGILTASDKGKTLQKLSVAGVRVPKTVLCERPVHVDWIVKQLGTDQLIIKTLRGSQGKTVAICDSKVSANSVLGFVYNAGLHVLIEEFIEAGATDYRVWVIGGKVVNVMKRSATKKGEFKANLSTGGIGEPATLSKEDEEIAIKAAAAIGLEGMAAVDLMKDTKEGRTYCIEVNSNGGEGIIEATGINHYENLIAYCEEVTGKSVTRSVKPGTRCTDPAKLKEWRRLIRMEEVESRVIESEHEFMRNQINNWQP